MKSIKAHVDRLGEVKAAIAQLQVEEKKRVQALKDKGTGISSGSLFDANVYQQDRTTVDWRALAEEVGYTERQLRKHTSQGSTLYCKVTARLYRV